MAAISRKPYLDRNKFHNELAICKKADKLSNEALRMFQLLAKEFSRNFFFENEDDRNDAVATAMHDLFKYWKNFKEGNVVQLKIKRNFEPGDRLKIYIVNHGMLVYRACKLHNTAKRHFEIGKTVNNSLSKLVEVIREIDGKELAIYVDKIKNKVTFMDKKNNDDLSIKSYVEIESINSDHFTDIHKETGEQFFFQNPPNAFSYFTSIVNNACLKSINRLNPKQWRNGDKVSFDHVNASGNGMFNLI